MTDILMRPIVRLQVKLAELREREDGQTTTEYAILLGFLAIAIIVALFFLQGRPSRPVLRCREQRLESTGTDRRRRPHHAADSGERPSSPVFPATSDARTFSFLKRSGGLVKPLLRPVAEAPPRTPCVSPLKSDGRTVTRRGPTRPSYGRRTSNMTDILMRPLVRLQVKLAELREREDGQTTTEYAILLGFLAIAIIVALFFLRGVLRDLFSDAASSVSNALRPATSARRRREARRRPGLPPGRLALRLASPNRARRFEDGAEGLVGTHPSAGCRKRRSKGT